jgi:hypothetical protein
MSIPIPQEEKTQGCRCLDDTPLLTLEPWNLAVILSLETLTAQVDADFLVAMLANFNLFSVMVPLSALVLLNDRCMVVKFSFEINPLSISPSVVEWQVYGSKVFVWN